ncbi:MAG: S8 family peptidase [Ignavibacteriales bacterium]|nr:S8 family peptidase [Ignavibacteriales bacterium]
MLRKFFTIIFLAALSISAQTGQKVSSRLQSLMRQNTSEPIQVFITFADKKTDLNTARQHPESVVSTKSLERRRKVLPENALIDQSDLPVSAEYISELEQQGIKIRHVLKWFNAVSAEIIPSKISKIASLPFVKNLDLLSRYKVQTGKLEKGKPVLPTNAPQSILAFDYGDSYPQVNQLKVPQLHNMGINGQGVIIAVLDAGFNNLAHEVFNTMQIIAKYDFVNHDPGVGDSTDLGSGSHGTATLSAIGGFKAGKLIGPAFAAKYILCKTENTSSETPVEEDNWMAAIQWADSIGADISSTALGYIGFDDPYTDYTWESMNGNTCRITVAADLAVKKGIAVFNSAGNEGFNAAHNTLGAPADGDSVIAVGAVDMTGIRVSFSSVGNTIDGRIKPDIMAMGLSVTLASPGGPNVYYQGAGTSFSCPLAAGAAALVLCARPYLTPMQLKNALITTASNSAAPNREYGWGIINAEAALGSIPLPVELVSFTAEKTSGATILKWSTATEKNNRGFFIESSIDKIKWVQLDFVEGNGSTTKISSYKYSDSRKDNGGMVYYRLRQVDFDGTISLSKTIETGIFSKEYFLSQNYPNPFNPSTTIEYHVAYEGNVVLKVFNIMGSEVKILVNGVKSAGTYSVQFDAGDLPSGMYCYSLEANNTVIRKSMMLLK